MADKNTPEKADAGKKSDAGKKKSPGMEKLIKNHFWILGGIALLTAAVVWYMGTQSLDAVFASDQQTNEKAFKLAAQLKNSARPNAPPNQRYAGKVDDVKQVLTKEVLLAWQNLYDRQTDLFKVNDKVQIFRDYVLMEPDDRKALIEQNRGLASNIAAAIQTYHNNQVLEEDFEKLFEPLNIRRARGMNAFGRPKAGAPAVAGGPPEGLVVWKAAYNPEALMRRYDTTQAPSLDRIAVTYEDLWTFRSLFGVVAKMNEKPIDGWLAIMRGETPEAVPVDQANVPIKRIDYCDLAQYAMTAAVSDPGNVEIAETVRSGGDAGAFGAAAGGAGGEIGGTFLVETSGSEAEDKKLLTGRYVDGRNDPVTDPSSPPFTEFRQMFVQITVLMDQRLIPVLIAQCANAPIPIETRQVRIKLDEVDQIRRVDAGEAAATIEKVEQSPHDATVTIRGIVYIYTKNDPQPNPEEDPAISAKRKLGGGTEPNPSKRDYGVPKKRVSSSTEPAF